MPRTNPAHAGQMRHRILDGAHRAMLSKGYRGATMPAIAEEAGVSVGLLYRYFASKEELYLAMCEAITEAQLDELAVQFGQIQDPAQRLASAVDVFVQSLEKEGWDAFVVAGWADADVNPALRDLLRRRCDQLRAFAAMFIRESIARGETRGEVDVELVSAATAMLLDGVLAHHAEMGDRFDSAVAKRAIIALLGRALLGTEYGSPSSPREQPQAESAPA